MLATSATKSIFRKSPALRALLVAASIFLVRSRANAQSEDHRDTNTQGAPQTESHRTPPQLLSPIEPAAPEGREAEEHSVLVHAVIETDGHVSNVHLETEGDVDFDRIALEAVQHAIFSAGTRDGIPVRARIRIAVHFHAPPEEEEEELTTSAETATEAEAENASEPNLSQATEHEHSHPPLDPEIGINVHDHTTCDACDLEVTPAHEREGEESSDSPLLYSATAGADAIQLANAARSASDFELDDRALLRTSRRDATDLLSSAPGLYVARPEGDAVAPHLQLRGFDADHGQDIEMWMGDVPLNQPSHIHAQGYANVNVVIPEVVRRMRVQEGVYDPRQGDFATAGTIHFDLGVRERGFTSRSSYGSYQSFRQLFLYAPEGEREETFLAAVFRTTQGFGQNRGGQTGQAQGQYSFDVGHRTRLLLHGNFFGARYGLAGILRRDDVNAGVVDFYGAYADPSAQSQSTMAVRASLGASLEHRGERGAFSTFSLYYVFDRFRQQANFTGYTQVSQFNPEWTGRGDLVEQGNENHTLGLRARHHSEQFQLFGDAINGFFEFGLSGRADMIGQTQNLLSVPQNETWDRRIDANILAVNVGSYLDLDLRFLNNFRLRGGLRADVLSYEVDDKLGNFIPSYRRESYIVGFRRTALGLALGPRASLEWKPLETLAFTMAYGQGYRSPQARILSDGENAPFARVQSVDLGFRFFEEGAGEQSPHPFDLIDVQGSVYLTHIDKDIAFDPVEARAEYIGPSTRMGFSLTARTKIFGWLDAQLSTTYVRATLDAPPPATIADPTPAYESGQALPYVPPWVVRGEVGARERIARAFDQDIRLRGGLALSYLSARPLPYSQSSDPFALLDLNGGISMGPVDLGVDIYNLFDARYAALEYAFSSNWTPTEAPSRLPARHFSAGAPRTVFFQATLHL